ncbi:hypothetical protein PRIPAC_95982 [Pristionchus pacificus]|uniref:Ribosomal protein n=1 Tax=Pristionchus pacificus TaxID=54126 RepID=A0A2A6D1I3_PRIPA|nr:hypothetical protein PRIPAC_95982 [Pristionchus pacificus]|eukprot:PDM84249.1 ribosomal protein [Pristionchus pacificus]
MVQVKHLACSLMMHGRNDGKKLMSVRIAKHSFEIHPSPHRRGLLFWWHVMWPLCTGAREAAFRNIKTIAECLAEELINAAKGSSNSYAIKKKD